MPDGAQLPQDIQRRDGRLELFTDDVSAAIMRLEQVGAQLGDLHISAPTLEDLFLKLTGHALRS